MIAVSAEFKAFVVDASATYGAASASKDYLEASQKEICDAMFAFVQGNRYGVESDDDGNDFETDEFALEVSRTLALRAATSRANSAGAKLAEKEKELNELKALLAKLQGVTV